MDERESYFGFEDGWDRVEEREEEFERRGGEVEVKDVRERRSKGEIIWVGMGCGIDVFRESCEGRSCGEVEIILFCY